MILALWQVGLLGYTYLLAGHAAREGARELAVNTVDTRRTSPTATRRRRTSRRRGARTRTIEIDEDDPVTVNVRLAVPVVLPGLKSPFEVSDHASTSVEDEPLPTRRCPRRSPGRTAVVRERLADESGQASAELMGMLFWLLLVTVIVWQVALAAWTYTQVSNAARTASRVEGRGGDAKKAAKNALSSPLQQDDREDRDRGRPRDGRGADAAARPRSADQRQADRHPLRGAAVLMGLRDRIAGEPGAGRSNGDDGDGVSYYRQRLLEEVNLTEIAELSSVQRRARLERVVGRMVSREGPVLSTAERTRLIRRVIDEAIGLGVLEPLLADPSVTEIMVNGPDEVYLERNGRLERADITFTDEAQLYQTIDRIVSQVNRRVDESSPMVDARLPTGERVNVIIPPLALRGPTMTIRRFPRLFTLDQLTEMGSLDAPTTQLLRAVVEGKLNVVISGGTGAGKTTLLNALSAAVPPGERIITVEDNAELRLQQPHVVTLEARPSNVEGKGEVSIRDLVRNSLRMRPDRIIVGEVRGAETLDMLQALNTGHEGSLVTVHANSPDDAIHRLETLATMSDLHIPFEALRDQINSAIHVIVQIDRYADGRRRIAEVAIVASTRRETFRLGTVARFEADAVGADRRVTGRVRHFPLPPAIHRRLELMGLDVPAEFGPAADLERTPVRTAELTRWPRTRSHCCSCSASWCSR